MILKEVLSISKFTHIGQFLKTVVILSQHTANIYDRITMELQSIIVPLLYFAVIFLYIQISQLLKLDIPKFTVI